MKFLVIILALLLAAPAQTGKHRRLFTPNTPTAPVNTGTCSVSVSGSATFSCPFTFNTVAGHLLIAVCGEWTNNAIGVHTIADSQGNTFSSIGAGTTGLNTGNGNSNSWAWSAIAGSSAADTITCTFTAGTNNYIIGLVEYAATTIETSAFTNVGNATANATNSITTAVADLLLTYCMEPTTDVTVAVSTAGFVVEITDVSVITLIEADKGNVAAGSPSVTCTRTTPGSPLHAGLIALH